MEKIYTCPECGESFETLNELSIHIDEHINNNNYDPVKAANKDFQDIMKSFEDSVTQFDEWYAPHGINFIDLLGKAVDDLEISIGNEIPGGFGLDKVFSVLKNETEDSDLNKIDFAYFFENYKPIIDRDGMEGALEDYAANIGIDIDNPEEYNAYLDIMLSDGLFYLTSQE